MFLIEKRGGIAERCEINREIVKKNNLLRTLRQQLREVNEKITELLGEKGKQANERISRLLNRAGRTAHQRDGKSHQPEREIIAGDNIMASIDERLEKLKKQKEELKAKEKKLLAQKASAERKKRTKRLIEVGAAVESVLKQPIEKEDLPKLINFLEQQEERGNYFSKAMK